MFIKKAVRSVEFNSRRHIREETHCVKIWNGFARQILELNGKVDIGKTRLCTIVHHVLKC